LAGRFLVGTFSSATSVIAVVRLKTMNPYDPPEIPLQLKASVRLHWFAFASAATVAFGVASWINHLLGADSRPFISTPKQFIISYLPVFVFSAIVGAVNLLSPTRGYSLRSPVSVRLIGGAILGLVPIPLNVAIMSNLWVLPQVVPFKVAEIIVVISVPVVVCTVAERAILRGSRRARDVIDFNDEKLTR